MTFKLVDFEAFIAMQRCASASISYGAVHLFVSVTCRYPTIKTAKLRLDNAIIVFAPMTFIQ